MLIPKILVCGLGSIGSRHVSNLLALGYDDLTLVTRRREFPQNWAKLEIFDRLDAALLSKQYSHALICTPTSQHMGELKAILRSGIAAIYLEKPISHSLVGLEEILELKDNRQKIVVGYDLRFDPGITFVRQLITSGNLGRILSANSFVGQYLPDWRPYEDYKKGSSALRAKGGGVLLDLAHEFDYLYWLMGKSVRIGAFYHQNPELDIETEDLADVLLLFESGATATLHLDYHQRKLERFCLITGTRGTIRWDLATKRVEWTDETRQSREMDFSTSERNDRFISIMKAFLSGRDDERLASFEDGVASLKMVMAAKKSSESHTFVEL